VEVCWCCCCVQVIKRVENKLNIMMMNWNSFAAAAAGLKLCIFIVDSNKPQQQLNLMPRFCFSALHDEITSERLIMSRDGD